MNLEEQSKMIEQEKIEYTADQDGTVSTQILEKELNVEDSTNHSSSLFGKSVSRFRKALDLTQDEFGKLIMTSRITVTRIEKTEDITEVSHDMLYRIYYISSKMMVNEFFDEYVIFCAKQIYDIISTSLAEKIGNNIEDPNLKRIVRELKNGKVNNN